MKRAMSILVLLGIFLLMACGEVSTESESIPEAAITEAVLGTEEGATAILGDREGCRPRGGRWCNTLEARVNLLTIYRAYRAYHATHGTYPLFQWQMIGDEWFDCLSITGFTPWPGVDRIRYNYGCNYIETFSPGVNDAPCLEAIHFEENTVNSFTVAACANIDSDPIVDEWTINDAGVLRHVVDDCNGWHRRGR